jgi:restriction alleviation protein Lar
MTKAKPVKLKPCPFCGGKATISTQRAPVYAGFGMEAHAGCDSRRCKVGPQVSTVCYQPGTKHEANKGYKKIKNWDKHFQIEKDAQEKTVVKAVAAAARAWNRRAERGKG